MTHYFRHSLIAAALLTLFSASFALGASVIITPTGSGTYSVEGIAMDRVSGMELNITYDAASIATPKITQGGLVSGALLASKTTIPGTIKIAIISSKPFTGSGQIASINFATITGSGGITSITSNMIDNSGAPVASQASVAGATQTTAGSGMSETAGVPFQPFQPSQTSVQQPSTAPVQTTGSTMPAYLGTVTMPEDGQTRNDAQPADTTSVPVQLAKPAADEVATAKTREPTAEANAVLEPQKTVKVTITSHKGTLENFRTYKGDKSPAILIALFNKKITPAITQEPPFALSDGKTPVRILITLATPGDKSPNFALNGAKLLSLNNDDSLTWIIEAMPQANIVQANLTILSDSETIEYPLTLAPPVENISPSEADFATFLSDSGAVPPKRDLNRDGKHDYLDDFIYTANYLTVKLAKGKKEE